MVVEQHPKSRLTPQVAIVSEPAKPPGDRDGYLLIDLKDEDQSREAMLAGGFTRAAQVSKLAIARDLEFAGHDVDMEQVSRLFMESVETQLDEAIDSEGKEPILSRLKKVFSRTSA